MSVRQIILDTETTGIDPEAGHNVIEIGCVEMVRRKLTGNTWHQYIKPDREVEAEAIEVHGITNEFLADKPRFAELAHEFLEFVRGAELIIHNAAFDIGFLNTELARNGINERVDEICTVIDTLMLARKKHPGQRNSLDALCRRYGIDNSHRELHGALLDSEILADVYLVLTGGQTSLQLGQGDSEDGEGEEPIRRIDASALVLPIVRANTDEIALHEAFLDLLDKKSDGAVWRNLS
ncbi:MULTISPECIES: DNA polymerase III subunit epsilon [Marinobacterium]|uniref:DNA polymerase III subunit epsilon n=1 Tax=Marinobacterium iners DSM 11526 TaxID=1122198 RepID=A0A1H4BA75_9GAMM|nr:DNA polymerase III subunit epsilon [Marinobacterium iners]QSR35060.1 DNA polymerase III subunit epsilon [Marinobacterium iners]SEA44742.1 DNA polymerase-3 subunit epsilon [Marinobacterium iners DSM 11526]